MNLFLKGGLPTLCAFLLFVQLLRQMLRDPQIKPPTTVPLDKPLCLQSHLLRWLKPQNTMEEVFQMYFCLGRNGYKG